MLCWLRMGQPLSEKSAETCEGFCVGFFLYKLYRQEDLWHCFSNLHIMLHLVLLTPQGPGKDFDLFIG